MSGVHVLGVRHHGPATARALVAALDEVRPDCVLVEGPPEADPLIPHVADADLRPPVAVMVCLPDEPGKAAFWPFAEWSPEWQALRWAVRHGVTARFMDLPFAARFDEPADGARVDPEKSEGHPLALLAHAAGATDGTSWWDAMIEHRAEVDGLFDAVLEAMQEARPDPASVGDEREARREAWMRKTLREARREGFQDIAVVCGAWHAPALAAKIPRVRDDAVLKGLSRKQAVASWAPWTPSRLASWSGYGAGVDAPGWYAHLWAHRGRPVPDGHPDPVVIRWISRAAALLRAEGLDASAASVIEAVRLAEALAALRDRPAPDLPELREAIRAVLCGGYPEPLELVRRRLEVGEGLGSVPEAGPAVPLQQDLLKLQKTLRLKPEDGEVSRKLDLRNERDRERSRLLRRLIVLDIPWGSPEEVRGVQSTFNEAWRLDWKPEYAARVVEAAVWGHSVEGAATNRIAHDGRTADSLPRLVALLDRAVLASLPAAVDDLLQRTSDVAALAPDLSHLLQAIPGLARLARYGDVRGTDAERLLPIVRGLLERVLVGLRMACVGLDDEAAAAMAEHIAEVHAALATLDQGDLREAWREQLQRLPDDDAVDAGIRGRVCRLLLEDGQVDAGRLERLAGLALSPAVEPLDAARWLGGLLKGSGLVLLHHDGVWRALDTWLQHLDDEAFPALLPMVRRAFSDFTRSERREMGDKVVHLGADRPVAVAVAAGVDADRAGRVLPVLATLLGVSHG